MKNSQAAARKFLCGETLKRNWVLVRFLGGWHINCHPTIILNRNARGQVNFVSNLAVSESVVNFVLFFLKKKTFHLKKTLNLYIF